MVLGGVFDKVDRSLRICFAHGGGSFPMWLGRMEYYPFSLPIARIARLGRAARPARRFRHARFDIRIVPEDGGARL
jgi:hypothetical protein